MSITEVALVVLALCAIWSLIRRRAINVKIHSVNVKDPDWWLKDLMDKQKEKHDAK